MNYKVGDFTLASCISGISVVGTFLNCLALCYFRERVGTSKNRLYFRHIYSIIALVDVITCVSLFPVIEAALRPGRQGTLFGTPWMCELWGVVWICAHTTSILLISMLSVSRLLTMIFPILQLKAWIARCVPVVYVFILLFVVSVMFFSDYMSIVYRSEWLTCHPAVFPAQADPNSLVELQDLERGLVLTTLFSLLPGFSIVPIAVASMFCLLILRRSVEAATPQMNRSSLGAASPRIHTHSLGTRSPRKHRYYLKAGLPQTHTHSLGAGLPRKHTRSLGSESPRIDRYSSGAGPSRMNRRSLGSESPRVHKCVLQRNSATVTVILVTLVYTICNLPYSLAVLGRVIFSIISSSPSEMTIRSYNTSVAYNNEIMINYGYFIVFHFCICLNSMLNPFIYLWRMDGFGSWIKSKITGKRRRRKIFQRIHPTLPA